MVKHNNVLPNAHFRKEWDMRVKTWLDQPARKQRRRAARQAKAAAVAPAPVSKLRPVVRCQTQRYNMKVRAGRGFTLEEIKGAGLTQLKAKRIGIAVDARRRNKSEEGIAANVARLKEYTANVVVKTKGNAAEFAKLTQKKGAIQPIARSPATPALPTASLGAAVNAYQTLRKERMNARMVGKREKKAKEQAEKDKAAAKKAGKAGGDDE